MSRKTEVHVLTPTIVRVINAAAHASRRAGSDRKGDAHALRSFAHLALVSIPDSGVLAPLENDLHEAIHAVAARHLGYARATRNLRRSLHPIQSFDHRDAVESAHMEVVLSSARAHYYAGLAWGLMFAQFNQDA